jgi:uncharacterized protein
MTWPKRASTTLHTDRVPRWLLYGGGGLVLFVVVVLTLAYLFQRKLIYLPATDPVPPAAEVVSGARDVELRTADGLTLHAWFVPGTDGPAVLVAPGNAGDRTLRAGLAEALRARGVSVLLLDYRGYGGNPGDPTEAGLALDVRAAREYLVESGIPQRELIYYGESLGAAVVTELAIEFPPAALVLRSPFTELADVAAEHYPFLPVRMLLKDRFPLVEQISRVRVPTTVVYGDADTIVPPAQSRAVGEAAGGPVTTVVVRGADHNDPVLLDGRQLIDAVARMAP